MKKVETTYEVWVEEVGKGIKRPLTPRHRGYRGHSGPTTLAREYNDDELERAAAERRKVRERFFVVKAVTTFEEIQS